MSTLLQSKQLAVNVSWLHEVGVLALVSLLMHSRRLARLLGRSLGSLADALLSDVALSALPTLELKFSLRLDEAPIAGASLIPAHPETLPNTQAAPPQSQAATPHPPPALLAEQITRIEAAVTTIAAFWQRASETTGEASPPHPWRRRSNRPPPEPAGAPARLPRPRPRPGGPSSTCSEASFAGQADTKALPLTPQALSRSAHSCLKSIPERRYRRSGCAGPEGVLRREALGAPGRLWSDRAAHGNLRPAPQGPRPGARELLPGLQAILNPPHLSHPTPDDSPTPDEARR